MISLTSKGDWGSTIKQLKQMATGHDQYANLDKYGKAGVAALARATPVDTGLTADSWKYTIVRTRGRPGIEWYNTNVVNGTSVAILIQYGHGTGTGGYVRGKDYINPAMRPVFDQIVSQFFKEVSSWRR
jgi:hypothetical protein